MRITNKMMSNNSLSNINTNKEYLDHLNNQMATEKKITRPSDDPIIAIRALRLRSNLSEIGQYYGSNVPDAQAWVMVTQSAIESAKGMISSMKALCDQGANGTNTVSERQNIYQELQGLQKQIYANGNATDAGRTVFTGYRTGEKLTFTEDTEAEYRGIWDTFNSSDVKINTYTEGGVTLDDINSFGKVDSSAVVDDTDPDNPKLTIGTESYPLTKKAGGGYELLTVDGKTYSVTVTAATATTPASTEVRVFGNETEVKEDRVNRIRLSYDNINGSVRQGMTEGWNGDQLAGISGWDSSADYTRYFNEDGTIKDDGKNWSGTITVGGTNVSLRFKAPYDQTFNFEPEYTRENILSSTSISGTSDEIKVKDGDFTNTITKDALGNYSADKGASVKNDGSGGLTLTIPGPNGTTDIYKEISIDTSGTDPALTGAGKYTKITDINYWIANPEYSRESIKGVSVSGTPDEIKVVADGKTYTITKTGGTYTVDQSGSYVEVDGSGKPTLVIRGPGGTMDPHTEVEINAATPSLAGAYKCTLLPDKCDYAGQDNALAGKAFGTHVSDKTTLIYRTELAGQASIPQSSVTTDPVDGLQSFELDYGSKTYKIQKFAGEDRWFAVDSSGHAISDIGVVQNSDKSFTITVASDSTSSSTANSKFKYRDGDVFNVSANGRSVTSYYHQTALKVEITDSYSPVAVDAEGNELTAYQYLALGPDNKNIDTVAADKIYLLADTGELVFGSDVAKTLGSLKDIPGVDTISVTYDKSSFEEGDLRPEHYFDATYRDDEHNALNAVVYDDHDQTINYTVGTGQSIQINTNAEDVFDTQIVRTIDDVLTAIDTYNQAEDKVNRLTKMRETPESYTDAQMTQINLMYDAASKELDLAKNKLQSTYERAISECGQYFDQANLAETACGTVENRLELISNRLSEEKTTVTTLASDNENVDLTNIAVEVSEANLVYNAALMATGRISQQTLVDYI